MQIEVKLLFRTGRYPAIATVAITEIFSSYTPVFKIMLAFTVNLIKYSKT